MTIYTWKPDRRNAVIRRRMEKGSLLPDGVKIIGEWIDMAGSRIFRLVEIDDAAATLAADRGWSDLGRAEMVPVIETRGATQGRRAEGNVRRSLGVSPK